MKQVSIIFAIFSMVLFGHASYSQSINDSSMNKAKFVHTVLIGQPNKDYTQKPFSYYVFGEKFDHQMVGFQNVLIAKMLLKDSLLYWEWDDGVSTGLTFFPLPVPLISENNIGRCLERCWIHNVDEKISVSYIARTYFLFYQSKDWTAFL